MEDKSGLEKSSIVLSRILRLAQQNGISHWQLNFADLELDQEYATFFWPCIKWLENEALVSVGQYARTSGGLANGAALNIVLTSKGIALLGTKITINETEITLSQAVEAAAIDDGRYGRIGEFFGGLAGGFTKSLSS